MSEALRSFVFRQREKARRDHLEHSRLSQLLAGSPLSNHADYYAAKARRRFGRWRWLFNRLSASAEPETSA